MISNKFQLTIKSCLKECVREYVVSIFSSKTDAGSLDIYCECCDWLTLYCADRNQLPGAAQSS